MPNITVEITDNSGMVKEEIASACLRALEKCGLTAEGYAKKLCPVDTGNLRNSITHQVDEGGDAVYIGTNSEYGAYVITERNSAPANIIPAGGKRRGPTRMLRANGTLPTANAHSRI